jgi:hypothetical protein
MPLEVEEQFFPRLQALANAIGEADESRFAARGETARATS